MNVSFGKLIGRFGGNAAAFIAVILWLHPGSLSILCVAPGGHIEIEDVGADCCASSSFSTPFGCQPDNGLTAPGNCRNCKDYLLSVNAREAVSKSYTHVAANPFADECPGNRLSADTLLSQCGSDAVKNIDVPNAASPSAPLLC